MAGSLTDRRVRGCVVQLHGICEALDEQKAQFQSHYIYILCRRLDINNIATSLANTPANTLDITCDTLGC